MINPMEQAKPPPSQEKKASLEDTMSELAKYQLELSKSQAQFVNETRTSLTTQEGQLRNLEVQMGQMASMFNERQQGNLPRALEVNLRQDGNKHSEAIILRSGKTIEKLVQGSKEENSTGNGENSVKIEENSVGNSYSSVENYENSTGTTEKAEKLLKNSVRSKGKLS